MSAKNDCFRSEAEKHWIFIKPLLCKEGLDESEVTVELEKTHYLYVEAMVHGYKHAKQETP